MYTVDIGSYNLSITDQSISFAGLALRIEEIEGISIKRSDVYLNGAWVRGVRVIELRGPRRLRIDCSQSVPDRGDLERLFGSAFDPIWSAVGPGLVSRFLSKVQNGETVSIGNVRVDVEGVYVDGNWKFLWLKAKPKLVPWIDLKMFSTEGVLFLQSIRDARFRSEISFNETENALVLSRAIAFLHRDNNWVKLKRSPTI